MHIKLPHAQAALMRVDAPQVQVPPNLAVNLSDLPIAAKFETFFSGWQQTPEVNSVILTDPAQAQPDADLAILEKAARGRSITVHFFDSSSAAITAGLSAAFTLRASRTQKTDPALEDITTEDIEALAGTIRSSIVDIEASGRMKVVRSATSFWPFYGDQNGVYNIHFDMQESHDFAVRFVYARKNNPTVIFADDQFDLSMRAGKTYKNPVISFREALAERVIPAWSGHEGCITIMRPPAIEAESFQVVRPSAHSPGAPDGNDHRRWTVTHDAVFI